jgi:hypothetical protein
VDQRRTLRPRLCTKNQIRHFDPAKAGSGLPEMSKIPARRGRRNLAFSSRMALRFRPKPLTKKFMGKALRPQAISKADQAARAGRSPLKLV